MRAGKKLAAVLASAVATVIAAPAQPAAAAAYNCFLSQNLCLFYGTFNQGSYVFFTPGVNDANLNDNTFAESGSGQGQTVGNNTRSASNYNSSHAVVLCTGVNYSGICRILAASDDWNLPSDLTRNVESFYWVA
ncbi:peptidase inhibitor family I36 protein [Sphaerisporangium sp. B11E5]|uniref:peptidase inhibitor family I36 protein n=1 Tax=Sphaerisporangium sp. B11E5 TaxID=3153563 RepID=UPI00325CB508